MPYGSSILEEELKKGETVSVGWPWRIMIFSVIVFLTAIGIFLGVRFGFKAYLNSQIAGTDAQIDSLTKSIPEDQQDNFLTFYAQASNIQKVLSERYSVPGILSLLEKNTLKNIYFKDVTFDAKERSVNIDGFSPDFNVLAQQMEVFRNASDVVSRVTMGRSSLTTARDRQGREVSGLVNFMIILKLK